MIRHSNRNIPQGPGRISKRDLLPAYMRLLDAGNLDVATDPTVDSAVRQCLRMKPRRTASGVATITVITMPHPCSGNCAFCPCDVSMPKSYLASEPACQRALDACFDPYVQVSRRLRALTEMGHVTGKVEMIVLGGTWDDYPATYREWFVSELFRALGDGVGHAAEEECERVMALYRALGISPESIVDAASRVQVGLERGELSYNEAVRDLYGEDTAWERLLSARMGEAWDLGELQRENESADHRMVGLSLETRPDRVTPESLASMRRLGCTKIQIGVQSMRAESLESSSRGALPPDARRAMVLSRLAGLKSHVHFMPNLPGANVDEDLKSYISLFEDASMMPDEIKLYPCVLVRGTQLVGMFERGEWAPYSEDALVDLLESCELATPVWCRISRMVRDISAHDIVAGNRKVNLRQMVDARLDASGANVGEIRRRELALRTADTSELSLDVVEYVTDVTSERFLQWVTPDGSIAGFCRLSLPLPEALALLDNALPISAGQAMIRELHVYGRVSDLHAGGSALTSGNRAAGEGVQHRGLGSALVARACEIAHAEGFSAINVISAVGTRGYYRSLGFSDAGPYQRMELPADPLGPLYRAPASQTR